jgi:hypothetical protein
MTIPVTPITPVAAQPVAVPANPPAVPVAVPVAKLFHLVRAADVSGVSGTGTVAIGTEYPNGKCTLSWLDELSCIGVYDSLTQLVAIHGHEGRTTVVYI